MEQKIIIDDREIYISKIVYDGEYYIVFLGTKCSNLFSSILGASSYDSNYDDKLYLKTKEEPTLKTIHDILKASYYSAILEKFEKKKEK